MKISHETIAPWPLFPHTFIAGRAFTLAKLTSRNYLINTHLTFEQNYRIN